MLVRPFIVPGGLFIKVSNSLDLTCLRASNDPVHNIIRHEELGTMFFDNINFELDYCLCKAPLDDVLVEYFCDGRHERCLDV